MSDLAITGLYFFDNNVIKYSKKLKPSKRGEFEITDLLNFYKSKKQLKADLLEEVALGWIQDQSKIFIKPQCLFLQ